MLQAQLGGSLLSAPVLDKVTLPRIHTIASPEAARQEGIKIAQEMLEAVRPMMQGIQVSAPFGRYSAAAEVIASVLPPAPALTE